MEYKEIDYTSLTEKIVEQAHDSAFRMTEDQKNQMIREKFERAQAQYRAMKAMPCWHTDL